MELEQILSLSIAVQVVLARCGRGRDSEGEQCQRNELEEHDGVANIARARFKCALESD